MAVAVPTSSEAQKSSQPLGLVAASVAGAAFVLAAAGVVLRLIPWLWDNGVNDAIGGSTNSFVSTALQLVVQVGAAIGLIWGGSKLASGPKAVGVRGGILLMVVVVFIAVFCLKGFYEQVGRPMSFSHIVVLLFYVVMGFLLVQLFRTKRFSQWAIAIDQGGWLDTHTHKRTQGLRVRRLTMLGILLIAGAGIWTLMNHNYLPKNSEVTLPNGQKVYNRMGDWVLGGTLLTPELPDKDATLEKREALQIENRARPRVEGGITLIPDLQFTVPLLLIAFTLWFTWRAVNYPTFADFLIATEAEINKVSWTSRKALIRDTVVVLTSLILLTVFLFVVDMFWNTLLSHRWIGVLPTEKEQQEAIGKVDSRPVTDW
ncbi:MAG TPA: preprotein translocase subunit SecE [Gemmataceae bacterium]|nr:preprotein translocase subunit SecE [Gemmataceae bacterium]